MLLAGISELQVFFFKLPWPRHVDVPPLTGDFNNTRCNQNFCLFLTDSGGGKRTEITLSMLIGLANTEAGSKDEHPKPTYNMANSIGSTPKPDLLSYQQITQQFGNKYQPQQLLFQQYQNDPRTQQLQQSLPYNHHQHQEPMKKPFHQQPTPVAMVIIAQPAYIPASVLQNGNVAQQLIQYFQGGNTQARYQYIPVNHQPYYNQPQAPVPTQQFPHYSPYQPPAEFTKYQPPTASAQPELPPQAKFQLHEALPSPQALISQQHHIVPHHLPQQQESRALNYQSTQQEVEVQPQQLQEIDREQPHTPEITRLAQEAAQHFISTGGLSSGSRTAPAIITGLELFSPEQQEKIKAQLSEHFGSPLKPLNLQGKKVQEKPVAGRNNFYQEFKQRIKKERFVPSIEVKDGEIKQTGSGAGEKM
ncbi:uncharacterized protein LOC126744343 isoform X2 [Anthonomus grandis grandis]|uniref:uncharacterized protein LOC126744343 isoform X2 n=1 Tax=Anthonomus grandis grandis TaxID=2921223 RepID=UPI002165DA40|nr:uncharacterized protein LOC126744343 isoform X2 [Anthonomus grandis grandis]